jgi:phosphonate transport system substrate-binding protein
MKQLWSWMCRQRRSLASLAAVALIFCGGVLAIPVRAADYSLAVVPQFDARKIESIWGPVVAAVKRETGITLVLRGNVSIPEFERHLYAGAFDFAYMNPYHFVRANRAQGYNARLRDFARPLQGVLVVRKDSPIRSVAELDGRKIAMPAPNALGAALISRAEFARKFQIKPVISYVKSHSSVYRSVVAGTVDAGCGVEHTLNAENEALRSQLRILYKTLEVPPHPLAVHPRVSQDVAEKVVAAMLRFAATPEGAKLFASIPMKKPGRATTAEYAPLEALGLDEFFVKN